MTIWFNQTVVPGATGFPAGVTGQPDWYVATTTRVNVSAKNASGTDATITYTYRDGQTNSDVIASNSTYEVPGLDISRFNVTGNGATLALWMGWPERKPPESLSILGTTTATITGTVATNSAEVDGTPIGTPNMPIAVVTSGTLSVAPTTETGITSGSYYVYTVPVGRILRLNSAGFTITAAGGNVTLTGAQMVQGTAAGAAAGLYMALSNDGSGGSLTSSQVYNHWVYGKPVTSTEKPVVLGGNINYAEGLAYPIMLDAGNVIGFTATFTIALGAPNAVIYLDGALFPA